MTTLELLNEIANAPAFMGGSERYKSVAGSDILYQQDIEQVRKDLDLLDLYKKFFKYSLTEIQGIKYLTLPNNSDIRRPDSMLKITNKEYELLKEGLEK